MNKFSSWHYEELAKTVRQISRTPKKIDWESEQDIVTGYLDQKFQTYKSEIVAGTLIDMLENDNPKFDRVKFIEACGLGIDTPVIEDVKI